MTLSSSSQQDIDIIFLNVNVVNDMMNKPRGSGGLFLWIIHCQRPLLKLPVASVLLVSFLVQQYQFTTVVESYISHDGLKVYMLHFNPCFDIMNRLGQLRSYPMMVFQCFS